MALPLEEAPFETYLQILRDEGYEQQADDAESFYIEILTQFDFKKEDIYKTPFKNLASAVEKILSQASREITSVIQPVTLSGPMLVGKDIDDETIRKILPIHMRHFEEHKLNQMMK